jgi:hypothetical protein
MKSLAFSAVFVALAPFVACSSGDVAPTVVSSGGTGSGATGGTTGASGGTTGGGAGTSTTGGTGGTGGGTGGAGGTTGGTGGTAAGTGGAGGSSGAAAATGGMSGTLGTTGGSAGTGGNPAGGMGNQAGGGMGAMSGGGGRAAGGMAGASAGMAGSSAGTGSSGCPTIAELFPASGNLDSLDGRLVTTPCSPTNSDDCSGGGWIYKGTTSGCTNGSLTAQQDFAVGGTPGQSYQVTMHFYGVTEPKNYGNMVTREAGNTRPTHMATGASPAPFASAAGGVSYPASDYNTYEIHVIDDKGTEVKQYFLNSDTQEGHWTYALNYERTIPVIGGGKVRMRTYDRNCKMIKNCGDRSGQVDFTTCSGATKQTVDVSAAMPPPMGLNQPGLGQASAESGQWLLLDVTKVACE